MPNPVSLIRSRTHLPVARGLSSPCLSAGSTMLVLMRNRPALGMASRAFAARFSTTCSSWVRIHFDAAEGRIERCLDGDVLPDDPAQQSLHVGQQTIHVDKPGLKHLLAGEGKQLLG